jgi:hypothetical protein
MNAFSNPSIRMYINIQYMSYNSLIMLPAHSSTYNHYWLINAIAMREDEGLDSRFATRCFPGSQPPF